MKINKLFPFFWLLIFGIQFKGCYSEINVQNLWPSTPHENSSIYLGYANNPFGSSIHIENTTKTVNVSEALDALKLSSNKMPNGLDPLLLNTEAGRYFSEKHRSKRGVIHLYNMVSCATGCNPLIYKGYGCYCGFLGSGYAVDGIDRCCKMHDRCYDKAKCPMFLEYFVPYLWKCHRNRPLCAISYGEWGGSSSCAQRLCDCDKTLSECLRKYPCPSSRALCRSSPLRLIQNALMIF